MMLVWASSAKAVTSSNCCVPAPAASTVSPVEPSCRSFNWASIAPSISGCCAGSVLATTWPSLRTRSTLASGSVRPRLSNASVGSSLDRAPPPASSCSPRRRAWSANKGASMRSRITQASWARSSVSASLRAACCSNAISKGVAITSASSIAANAPRRSTRERNSPWPFMPGPPQRHGVGLQLRARPRSTAGPLPTPDRPQRKPLRLRLASQPAQA